MSRILIVEDDRFIARGFCAVLEQHSYTPDIADTRLAAIDLIRSNQYRAVLLDWSLPDGSGVDVLRCIRAEGIRVPVMIVTGRASVPDKLHAFEAGADDYVVKPVDIRELAARVAALIRRSDDSEGPLRCGRITLHPRSYEAYVGASRLSLTQSEFRLLSFLLRSQGSVARRAEILAEVWGTNTDAVSNVVDVHMARLRDKLGEAREQIETIRGIGYRLRSGSKQSVKQATRRERT